MILRTHLGKILWIAALVVAIWPIPGCFKPSHDKGSEKPEDDQDSGADQPRPGNAEQPPAPPPASTSRFGLTLQPSLESIQKDLIDIYCTNCHSGSMAPAKLDLSDLGKFTDPHYGHGDLNAYHGRLIVPGKARDSMLHIVLSSTKPNDQMPPKSSGLPAVAREQVEVVDAWINALLPNGGGNDDEPGDDGGGDDEPVGRDDTGGADEP